MGANENLNATYKWSLEARGHDKECSAPLDAWDVESIYFPFLVFSMLYSVDDVGKKLKKSQRKREITRKRGRHSHDLLSRTKHEGEESRGS